jgi:circadian clock protein KaiB
MQLQDDFILKLYITRHTPAVTKSIALIESVCEDELGGKCQLEVIDISGRPDIAVRERILATPMLIKELPPPLRRVVGDMTDKTKLLVGLDYHLAPPQNGQQTDA